MKYLLNKFNFKLKNWKKFEVLVETCKAYNFRGNLV